MLTPEQAAERIAEFHVPTLPKRRSAALDALPAPLAKAGRTLCQVPKHSYYSHASFDANRTLGEQIGALTNAQRLAFFGALFPRLAPVVDRAWTDSARGTYTTGYSRKPFRAPNRPELIHQKRGDWLRSLTNTLANLDPDAEWLAAWAPHLGGVYFSYPASPLLAAAIDLGGPTGDAVLDILRQSASGAHEIGVMGRHIPRALLGCSRPEAWEFMEKMLLAAQRQEGLRQAIFETVDEAHPEAFHRFLRLIAEENLVRFSSTVRAVDVWFGFMYDAMSSKQAESIIARTLTFFDDPRARHGAIATDDGEGTYLALWTEAFHDIDGCLSLAAEAITAPSEERRFAAAKLLGHIGVRETLPLLSAALAEKDLRVAARALDSLSPMVHDEDDASKAPGATFDRLLALLDRIGDKAQKFKPLVFPWERSALESADVGSIMMRCVPPGQATRVLPVMDRFGPQERATFACLLVGVRASYGILREGVRPAKMDATARGAMIHLLGDPAAHVRKVAGEIMGRLPLEADEVGKHEALLERTAGDIRTRALERLRTLPDNDLLASVERLLGGGASARAGGLELLRIMSIGKRAADRARAAARSFQTSRPKLSTTEQRQVGLVLDAAEEKPEHRWTRENALGLLEESGRGEIVPPRAMPRYEFDAAAAQVLLDLDAIVEANKTRELKGSRSHGSEPSLLGGDQLWSGPQVHQFKTLEERRANCAVRDLLDAWRSGQGAKPDAHNDAILRAWIAWQSPTNRHWGAHRGGLELLGKRGRIRYIVGTGYLLEWLIALDPHAGALGGILDWTESAVAGAKLDPEQAKALSSPAFALKQSIRDTWGKLASLHLLRASPEGGVSQTAEEWIAMARRAVQAKLFPARPEDHARLWRLLRWTECYSEAFHKARVAMAAAEKKPMDWTAREKFRSAFELRPRLHETLNAWAAGAATEHDFYAAALQASNPSAYNHGFSDLQYLKRQRVNFQHEWPAGADAAYEALRSRIVEIELARGDAPTPASGPALALRPSGGLGVVIPVLARIGRERLLRGSIWTENSRAAVYSTLLRNAVPRAEESPAAFKSAALAESIPEDRLIELALYAPQWSDHVEHALGWSGFAEGVWWVHAHTKDSKWRIDAEIREKWDARIAERTPVPKDELDDGAVDPEWFARVHLALGPKRWEALYDAAKYASGSGGHKRAQLFADAMLQNAGEKELTERIKAKRHQDSVRALGLCPVKSGGAGTAQVLARYRFLQEFRRASSKHGGSMLQASDKRAVEIAMQNLARTAGYADPVRLQWAMETESVADLARGPITATVGETSVSLSIDEDGVPSLSAIKKGKALKSVPADAKKNEQVKALAERLSDLRRQGSRMRQSLELAMCRGDELTGDELASLWRHPMLRPMLSRLVLVSRERLGYAAGEGTALRDDAGRDHALSGGDPVRIAHPHDLLASKTWHDWQHECMAAQRLQPFKQVFRELYLPTAAEKGEVIETTRYRSHQVQPRQALALFGSRGWVARPEEGVHRTFHNERITAFVTFEEAFYTPAEIECLTLRGLSFVPVGKLEPLRIDAIPPRLFSEVMRDLDLVVSVAHAGAVDPEASQSSIEMRGALLRETARALSLDNLEIEGSRVTIRGRLGLYSLHLGSGTIQQLPGGSVFVVAVQSQHRGRVFLPFADDDPKTAEVLSKALLLSRDHEIKDPSILEQIRR